MMSFSRLRTLGPVHDKGRTRIACAKVMNMTHRSTRAKDLQYEGWKIQVANICLEWALTNDKPLIFDEILEEEEEDKILENEILENDRNLENPSMTREVGKSKVGNPNGRDSGKPIYR